MSVVHRLTLKDYLFMPLGCMFTASPLVVLSGIIIAVLIGSFAYYNWNVDLFGLGGPDLQKLILSPDGQRVTNPDGSYFVITYEKASDTQFAGLVRHVSPIRIPRIPILTHDILVTFGDFSDPGKVSTAVYDHHFFWTPKISQPQGGINLLHTVPKDDAIYQQLLQIRNGQEVHISGHEILRLNAYSADHHLDMYWQDSGCNSLLVDSVVIEK